VVRTRSTAMDKPRPMQNPFFGAVLPEDTLFAQGGSGLIHGGERRGVLAAGDAADEQPGPLASRNVASVA